nr:YihY/virulence factor BrkB family protein [Caulobacteraceae bacterium]
MSDPPAAGARRPAKLPFRAAPWLAMLAMAAFWPRRKRPRFADLAKPALTPEEIDAAEPGRGRNANFPWTIPALGWKDILWRTYREMGRNRLPALAGGVTFYLLLATFPAIAAFVSLYGLFLDVATVQRQLAHMSAFLPRDAVTLIGAQMVRLASQRQGTLGAAFVV